MVKDIQCPFLFKTHKALYLKVHQSLRLPDFSENAGLGSYVEAVEVEKFLWVLLPLAVA